MEQQLYESTNQKLKEEQLQNELKTRFSIQMVNLDKAELELKECK